MTDKTELLAQAGEPQETASLMLLEGAQDAIKALKLLRKGVVNQLDMRLAVGMIDSTIDELDYAVRAYLSAKAGAA